MPDRPVYPIGIVSDLLNVHPETLRVWERNGIVKPRRRSGKRFYSQNDVKRLHFIQNLIAERLNLPAIKHYLQLYPCWNMNGCPGCVHRSKSACFAKPCWKEDGTYCQAYSGDDICSNCEFQRSLECQ